MASSADDNYLFRCEARKRMTTEDPYNFTKIAADLDENNVWSLISDHPLTAYGWNITFNAGFTFNMAVGAGVWGGVLMKTGAIVTNVTLTDNLADPVNPRIDRVEITGYTESDDVAANEVILGGITRNAVAAEAVGNGDGATVDWDLNFAGVDGRTLLVQVNAVPVGGWVLSPGTGAAGVDQIIFNVADAPALAAAITADYTYQISTGEAVVSVDTRKKRVPTVGVVAGTPGVGANAWTAGSIHLCEITVPASWNGGAPTTIDNTVKEFLVYPDTDAESDRDGDAVNDGHTPATSPYMGKLLSPIRGMDQVVHGMRLAYYDADQIQLTPGWGVLGGVSFTNLSTTLIPTGAGIVTGAGWWYVYAVVAATSSTVKPGSEIESFLFSSTPPSNLRRRYQAVRTIYLGAVYATGAGVIRPFYTHGDMVFWESPGDFDLIALGGAPPVTADLDISTHVPETGRLVYVRGYISGTSSAAAEWVSLDILSHQIATAKIYPYIYMKSAVAYANAVLVRCDSQGFIRAEDNTAVRYIHYGTTVGGAPGGLASHIHVQGYLDDYRTADMIGGQTFY